MMESLCSTGGSSRFPMSSSYRSAPAAPTHHAVNHVAAGNVSHRALATEAEAIAGSAISTPPAPSQPSGVRPFAGAIREDAPSRNPAPALADADNTPAVRLLNETLREATRRNASDLHIEPAEQGWRMRLRIDGVLHAIAQPPAHLRDAFITRVKVLARDRKSTRLNSSHSDLSRMPSSA